MTGHEWCAKVYAEKLAAPASLPRLGDGYSNEYRAAYAVASIADRKLYTRSGGVRADNPLPGWSKKFWREVLECAGQLQVKAPPAKPRGLGALVDTGGLERIYAQALTGDADAFLVLLDALQERGLSRRQILLTLFARVAIAEELKRCCQSFKKRRIPAHLAEPIAKQFGQLAEIWYEGPEEWRRDGWGPWAFVWVTGGEGDGATSRTQVMDLEIGLQSNQGRWREPTADEASDFWRSLFDGSHQYSPYFYLQVIYHPNRHARRQNFFGPGGFEYIGWGAAYEYADPDEKRQVVPTHPRPPGDGWERLGYSAAWTREFLP